MEKQSWAAGDVMIPLIERSFGSWRVRLDRRALSPGQIENRYDRIASTWHALTRRLGYPGAYRQALLSLLAICPPRPTSGPLAVLDCGAGCGTLSSAFAQVSTVPVALEALDTSRRMLDQAQSNFRSEGIAASTRVGDVCKMPYPDDSFDVVMAAHLLEHLHDPAKALQEMVRVTRPGGVIILCLTRRSLLGFYIHLTWRTHLYAVADARALLHSAGLDQHHMARLSVFSPLRHISIACIARKPHAIGAIKMAGTGPRRQI